LKTQRDELSVALEGLRNRPVITESREYARRWERSSARAAMLRRRVFAPVVVLLVMGVVAGLGYFEQSRLNGRQSLVATHVGETRSFALDDGTRMVLDTHSRVKVRFSDRARDVELVEGQAHFEVAPDVRRPFRVHTKAVEVVAVGTAFDVAALPSRTTVTLIEGRVNVRAISGTSELGPRVEMLTPGQQWGVDSEGQPLGEKEVKIANVTAWQRGNVVIDDAPLSEALAIMNRYSNTHLVVRGESLQARHVSGVFRIGDVETEAIVLERYFGLKETTHSQDEIVLERQ
jgi:transmembrane sensor